MVTSQAISENSRKTSLQARNLTILASLFIPPAYIAVSLLANFLIITRPRSEWLALTYTPFSSKTLFSTNIFTSNPQAGKMDTVQPQGWILAASTGGVVLVTLIILSVCFWPQISKNLEGCRRNSGSKEDFKTSAKEDSAGEEPWNTERRFSVTKRSKKLWLSAYPNRKSATSLLCSFSFSPINACGGLLAIFLHTKLHRQHAYLILLVPSSIEPSLSRRTIINPLIWDPQKCWTIGSTCIAQTNIWQFTP